MLSENLSPAVLCPDDLMALNTASLNVEWAYRVREALTTAISDRNELRDSRQREHDLRVKLAGELEQAVELLERAQRDAGWYDAEAFLASIRGSPPQTRDES